MSYTKAIQKMIDEGNDIIQVAKLFGGVTRLMELSKGSPYLKAVIQTKLGGQLYCSAEGDDGVMIPFELPFVLIDLEETDMDDINHYNAIVNVIIPELETWGSQQLLFTWLEDYLMDLGSEVGSFNDEKLNKKQVWIYAGTINGRTYHKNDGQVSDEKLLEFLPEEYKNP